MTTSIDLETISPHLVIGQSDHAGHCINESARVLHDLMVTFGPQGHYSVRSIEDECGPAVHCAFEYKADADRLAAAVGAIGVMRYQGYRSERVFRLNDAAAQELRLALASRRRLAFASG